MSKGMELRTDRLLLRRWQDSDRAPFGELNADPEVMRHFPAPLDRAQSDGFVARIEAGFDRYGYGLWALETLDGGEFLGFTGLQWIPFDAHFTPALEVGWRLARSAWGRGYATEAAREAVRFAFTEAGLRELVSMTTPANDRSQAVMRRLGMTRDPAEDFDHPGVPDGHPMRRHVLYRLPYQRWAGHA
jgi:ribosomal-protein-alanine N-acetyltransferase